MTKSYKCFVPECSTLSVSHCGGNLSANPLRWYSICKPTPVVLYLQNHHLWYFTCKPRATMDEILRHTPVASCVEHKSYLPGNALLSVLI